MKLIDKAIFGILAIAAIAVFMYGFRTSTGFAVATSNSASKIGEIGIAVWLVVLLVLLGLLLWLRRKKNESKAKESLPIKVIKKPKKK